MRNLSKLLVVFILILSLATAGSVTALAEDTIADDITIVFNGQVMTFDQPALGMNNRTFVPVRGIFEAYGASVEWDQATLTITADLNDKHIEMTVGKNTAYVNDEKVMIDAPPVVINGRTLVPVRFVSEALDAKVGWDDASRTVSITTPDAEFTALPAASAPAQPAVSAVPAAPVAAPGEIQWGVGYTTSQQGISGACYLASLSMVSGNLNNRQINCSQTYALNGSKAYVTYDLYQKINMVNTSRTDVKGKSVAEKTNLMMDLLKNHPEGVIAKFETSAGRTHFIVFRGYADGKFIVNDPVGQFYLPLDKTWTGYSMFPTYEAAMGGMVRIETFAVYSNSFNWSF